MVADDYENQSAALCFGPCTRLAQAIGLEHYGPKQTPLRLQPIEA